MAVKPNFLDPDRDVVREPCEYALCQSSLLRKNGLRVLLEAWKHRFPLPIRWDGPLRGRRHFLLRGEPGVPDRLATVLQSRIPGLQIAGTYSPPFRPLTEKEDKELAETLNRSSADIVWVGLSTPKQERWMHQHCHRLHAAVLLGVGAAFYILSGTKKQAPSWMQKSGLEWFFRLLQEPHRLWRRYLIYGPRFVYLTVLELFGLRKFS